MAATVGTIATAQTGSNSRLLSWGHTVAAADTLLIIAMAANGDNSDNRDISSLTVNGAPATFITGSQQFSTGGGVARWIEGWYFDVTGLSGTAAISVTYNSAGSTATIVGHSITFKGTDPTTPVDLPAAGTSGSTSPVAVTVSSASGGLVFSALSQRTGVATAYPSGATVTQTDSQATGGVYASIAVQPGAASVTASYTTPAANHALFAVNVNAASGGGSGGTTTFTGSGATSASGTVTASGVQGSSGGGSGQVTQVGATAVTEVATGTTLVANMPTGVQSGNLLLAAVGQKGSVTTSPYTAPAGWTAVPGAAATSGTAGIALFSKIATASEPTTYTWTSGVTDSLTAEISAWTGMDATTPFDAAAVTTTAGSSGTITLNTVTTVTANALVLYHVIGQTTGSTMVPDAALTLLADTTGTGRRIQQASEVMATPGTTTARVFTSTTSFTKAGILLPLRPAAAAPVGPTPTLGEVVVGVSEPTVGHVKVHTTNATSVRLRATPVGGGTALLGSAVSPSAVGASDLSVSGLTPGIWYNAEVGATNSSGQETFLSAGKFRAAPSGATSFGFDFGSCTDATDSAALAAVAARPSDLFLHVGDLWYADGSGTTVANFRAKMAAKVNVANHKAVFTSRSTVYTPSDHDGMNNNSDAGDDPTAWTNWNQVVREYFPSDKFPANTGVYYTFVWGRVRFIVWDDRSFKSDKDNADNASKTALGAAQLSWTQSVITAATEPVIVIVQSSPWIDTATASEDGWGGYMTERATLSAFFKSSGKNIVMLGGDMHAVAADDGTSANAGGVSMMLQAAPFNNSASQKGGPYLVGPYPTGSGTVQQYGHVDVTDNGTTITVAFQGLSSDNTQRVALSKTFAAGGTKFGDAAPSATGSATAAGVVSLPSAGGTSGTGAVGGTGAARLVAAASPSASGTSSAAGQARPATAANASGAGTVAATGAPLLTGVARSVAWYETFDKPVDRSVWWTGPNVAVESGRLAIHNDPSFYGIQNLDWWNFNDTTISALVTPWGPQDTGTYFEVNAGQGQWALGFAWESNGFYTYQSGDDYRYFYNYPASSSWWTRIRFQGTIAYLEMSPDGVTWTIIDTRTLLHSLDYVQFYFGQATWSADPANIGTAYLDNLRIEKPGLFANGTSSATGVVAAQTSTGAGTTSGAGGATTSGSARAISSAAPTAAGAASGSGTPRTAGGATPSGSGAIGATGRPTGIGIAATTSAGAATASGAPVVAATAATSASGTVTAVGLAAGNAAGSGSLDATGSATAAGSARVPGSGATSASGAATAVGTSRQNGSGATSAAGTVTSAGSIRAVGSAATSGAGSLAGTLSGMSVTSSASPAGTGTTTIVDGLRGSASVATSAAGTVVAAGAPRPILAVGTSASGTAAATVGGVRLIASGASTGIGQVVAGGVGQSVAADAVEPGGVGTATAAATRVVLSGSAVTSGWGTAVAAGLPRPVTAAATSAAGALGGTGAGVLAAVGSGTAGGSGQSVGAGVPRPTVPVSVTGLGGAVPVGLPRLGDSGATVGVGGSVPTGVGSQTAVGSGVLSGSGLAVPTVQRPLWVRPADLGGTGSVATSSSYLIKGTAGIFALGQAMAVSVVLLDDSAQSSAEGTLRAFGVASTNPGGRISALEMKMQRKNTVAYIASDPVTVVLQRTVSESDGAGGMRLKTLAPVAPQTMRLIESGNVGASQVVRTVDGRELQATAALLARWDADILVSDTAVIEGALYRVTSVADLNGYEVNAAVEYVRDAG